jgi:hypothetical protein
MNKPAAVGSVLVLGLAAFVAVRYSGEPNTIQHPSSKRVLYADPMHPAYHSDKPGITVDCGVALEPVYEGEDPAAKLQLASVAVSLSAEKQQLIGTGAKAVAKNSGSRLIRTTGRVERTTTGCTASWRSPMAVCTRWETTQPVRKLTSVT